MVPKLLPRLINGTTFHLEDHSQPSISVQLLESVLYTHTGNNPILRGVVEISDKKPVVVSSLRLDFKGHLAYSLVKPDVSCQKEFAQCSLSLYPTIVNHNTAASLLVIGGENSKPTRFVFEMPLLNNNSNDSKDHHHSLIQSIQSKEFKVKYNVQAILEYQPFCPSSTQLNKKGSSVTKSSFPQPITIIQIPIYDDGSTFMTNDCMLASIDSRKQSNQWCQYHVKVNKRYAAISSTLSLSVKVAPLIQGLKLSQVSMQLVQHYSLDSRQTYSRPPLALDCHFQSSPYYNTGGSVYDGEFQFNIPSDIKDGLVPSMQTNPVSNIKVSHHLLVNLTLTYPKLAQDGIVRQARRLLTFQCDFDLLHPCMADSMCDKILRLPAYDSPPCALKPTAQKQHPQYTRIAKELIHCRRRPVDMPPVYDHAIQLPPAVVL